MYNLPKSKQPAISEMIEALTCIPGITAIALGGSYARGTAHDDSDIDLSLYYSEKNPFSIHEIRNLAQTFDHSFHLTVTDFYEWGPWVNGGCWLDTTAGVVDWLYRNIEQVNHVIEEAQEGKFYWDFRQQPPYGFFSVTYLADIQQNIILYDPQEILSKAKRKVQIYPLKLKKAIIHEHLWSIEFTYYNANKLLKRHCTYGIVGCITRIAAELTQVLFALNESYFATEKNAPHLIEKFSLKPLDYANRLNQILSSPGKDQTLSTSLNQLQTLIQETIQLAQPYYTPKYAID